MLRARIGRIAVATLLLYIGAAGTGFAVARTGAAQQAKPAPGADPKEDVLDGDLRPATVAEKKAATAAIEAQLKAFRAGDYEKAARYQSEGLRRGIGSIEAFRGMMQRSYPQFASYKSVSFGEARAERSGAAVQVQVVLTGKDGKTVRAVYVMVREEGEYRVASVFGGLAPKTTARDVV